MFSHILEKTYSDKKYNEDVYASSNHFLLVLDGATGLGKKNFMSEDDALWFVQRVKEEVIKRIELNISLEEIVSDSIQVIQKEHVLDVETMDPIDMPSGCISLLRIKDNTLEYFGLGDALTIVELKDGTIESFYDDKIEYLDGLVVEQMEIFSKKYNIPFVQGRKYTQDLVIENRKKRNTENGYYSLDLSLKWKHHGMSKQWNIKDIDRVACMSDGFWQIIDHLNLSYFDVLNRVEENLDLTFKDLYMAQESDPDCEKVHRLKKRDDTTIVFAKVQE